MQQYWLSKQMVHIITARQLVACEYSVAIRNIEINICVSYVETQECDETPVRVA
jgi:hypothetical protein